MSMNISARTKLSGPTVHFHLSIAECGERPLPHSMIRNESEVCDESLAMTELVPQRLEHLVSILLTRFFVIDMDAYFD